MTQTVVKLDPMKKSREEVLSALTERFQRYLREAIAASENGEWSYARSACDWAVSVGAAIREIDGLRK